MTAHDPDRCALCGALLGGHASGSLEGRRPLCERCAVEMDLARPLAVARDEYLLSLVAGLEPLAAEVTS